MNGCDVGKNSKFVKIMSFLRKISGRSKAKKNRVPVSDSNSDDKSLDTSVVVTSRREDGGNYFLN